MNAVNKLLILVVSFVCFTWVSFGQVNSVENSSTAVIPLMNSNSCDEVEQLVLYEWEYWVVIDNFENITTYPVYIWWSYFVFNNWIWTDWNSMCLYNNSVYRDWTRRFLNFNYNYLNSLWWRVDPWQKIRHLTTNEEYWNGWFNGVNWDEWTLSGSFTFNENPWAFTFDNANVRNPNNHPSTLTTWTWEDDYDCQIRIWTVYDSDDNDSTISNNTLIIQCMNIQIRWCWDWIVQADKWEQCDDSNEIDWDGCSSSCQLEVPSCTVTPNPPSWLAPVTTNLTATTESWSVYTNIDYWDWTSQTNPTFPQDKTYSNVWDYSMTVSVQSTYSWPMAVWVTLPWATCGASVSANPTTTTSSSWGSSSSSSSSSWSSSSGSSSWSSWWSSWWGSSSWWSSSGWWGSSSWWGFSDTPNCNYIDPPSVQIWEYLPFWWELRSWITTNSCWSSTTWKYQKSSMECFFRVENWEWEQYIFSSNCYENDWPNIAQDFLSDYGYSLTSSDYDWRRLVQIDAAKFNWLWEYKIDLYKVEYKVCSYQWQDSFWNPIYWWDSWDYDWTVCQMNFSVSEPYLLQKWSTLSTVSNNVLGNMKYLDNTKIFEESDLSNIRVSSYTWWEDLSYILNDFIDKYENLAVKPDISSELNIISNIKKVPNKNIYIIDWWWSTINLKPNANVSSPSTFIIKNWNLKIRDNLDWNLVFIVPDWTVEFETSDCDDTQVVEWIFIAKTFIADRIINDDSNSDWCKDWRMKLDWMLIWIQANPFNDLLDRKRSFWWMKDGNNVIHINRSDVEEKLLRVFDWASLLIRTNTDIWMNLPPWTDELMEKLQIIKK